jgi:hypothetical protein
MNAGMHALGQQTEKRKEAKNNSSSSLSFVLLVQCGVEVKGDD